jgi:hypothetical protein
MLYEHLQIGRSKMPASFWSEECRVFAVANNKPDAVAGCAGAWIVLRISKLKGTLS